MFTIMQDGRWNTLKVQLVQTTYCRPQLEQCRCKSLLQSLLTLETSVNKITGKFFARPYIAGCKCYLGASTRQGFKYLKMEGRGEECRGTKEIPADDYAKMCETFSRNKCYGGFEMTKIDPDVE